ncbi:MAG: TIGR00282 family metallophosphoesterase [Bacillota bacterium]|nr:TIGR00282 family metallophosphoesterase [Bacillota bacterium]
MRILAIGDVVGSIGCQFLRSKLPNLKKIKGIDLVIANGENAADGNGITPATAEYLFASGVDVITLGNHAFRRKEIFDVLENNEYIVRPANYPENTTPGRGKCIVDMGRVHVCIINMLGNAFMESLCCPFKTMDDLLKETEEKIIIVDFHAEATGEKQALGYYLDGRVSAMFGTHTHVQTADEKILEAGTGFITDVGMTGPIRSVLGVKPELIIKKLKEKMPVRFDLADGECKMDCIIFDIDEKSGKTIEIERLEITA